MSSGMREHSIREELHLIHRLNILLATLQIPLALESLYELTPSLLLAIVESLLNMRLPRLDGPSTGLTSTSSSSKKISQIQTTKLVLGTLETDVLKADVGLSKVDPERLAEGGEEEVRTIARLLCKLLDSQEKPLPEDEAYASPRTATTSTKRGDWTPRAPTEDFELLSFARHSPHSDLSPLVHSTPPPRFRSHTSPQPQPRPKCIHEVPSLSFSGTCDCPSHFPLSRSSNQRVPEAVSPTRIPSGQDQDRSSSFSNHLYDNTRASTPRKPRPSVDHESPTKSPLRPRLGGWIREISLEEEVRKFSDSSSRRRMMMVHPDGASGDTTTSSMSVSVGGGVGGGVGPGISAVAGRNRYQTDTEEKSARTTVKNPILPASLSSSSSFSHSVPQSKTGSKSRTRGSRPPEASTATMGEEEEEEDLSILKPPLRSPSSRRYVNADSDDPQAQTVALLRERARLLGELARIQAKDALGRSLELRAGDFDSTRGASPGYG
ncbi:hypothetical protein K435DRAFT_337076 [Dendrothele bispora CBS 962.96]|uniref:DUF5745 domain-containing protein n=1 Tax=Dendrothele bispora (strain CBS 962.96) TaxID=1314807 RepID=A0A4S8LF64_DENBC|nr:hypothetical protein K435DRAFT_337076 [Dendrothele bispora CBS 962.96]